MAWKEETAMSSKKKFVLAVQNSGANFSAICKDFNISRECGYKWLRRFRLLGEQGLEEQPRRPHYSPSKTSIDLEAKILAVRHRHPAWGARKIHAYLTRQGINSLPVPSTITRILHRHQKIHEEESQKHKAFIRFEHSNPNDLWQMDFKGHFNVGTGICNPLTVLDDHSRFSLDIRACKNQQGLTVQAALTNIFREYGLPEKMTMDNGAPWGSASENSEKNGYTALEVWLILLGIYVGHSRPYHPQTQGKDERFHRSLKAELLRYYTFKSLEEAQQKFDEWRWCYNYERPHEALGMHPPISKYQPSPRKYPEVVPEIEYEAGSDIRKVNGKGDIYYQGKRYFISESMIGLPVQLAESERYGIVKVILKNQKVKEIDLINKVVAKKIL
jgi:transposase InsO family protein